MSLLNVSYNQKTSLLACATDTGFSIYTIQSQLQKKMDVNKGGGIGIMKVLNKSNLAVMVGGGDNPYMSRNMVLLYDMKNDNEIMKLDLSMQIKNVLIEIDQIIVVLQKKIFVFETNAKGRMIDSKPTYCNDKGLCVMNVVEEKPIIATLGAQKGEVAIWKMKPDTYRTIKAHEYNIEALAINREGTLIATASETGNKIKVFETETCKQVFDFRRGTFTAKIYDICFNKESTLLACVSGNGTVHVFDLVKDVEKSTNSKSMLYDYKDYLPEYVSSQWSFKQIYLPSKCKMICGFDDEGILHVTGFDGKYYRIGKDYEVKESDLKLNKF